ncbi:MAG: hypothetical protein A3C06_00740 [Candidatus Taylorbacteria bacterium RIFCSPHIGHO2_02_FULL_46_13]|uniref:HIT domain-containing protein n=2 Tax=Parcubacteria group TaxID=1794811 RepID=A0A1G2HSR8_9BACT|nr:MAG: hypothetical protein A2822_03560 [Candidatus Staskawiczbacteria bacterium RIFCSPHIGHO2_01_FULL_41_41]OGZ75024.1 MAG: hypothetical protein A3A12_04340 [Candidatus Staskawiczbacteria bacterium RIFCSPLOWO2_01_FULL_43_17b]OHA26065.1 MAG: hypothetical protein A3C06_00740 [Candidatus Taylorbacteria bacterium RIFCSPHIGHO2_02_FULL_46_13]
MDGCIFCKIVAGEIPSYKVYEDDAVLAFLDIEPATRGHALVIPKRHAENVFEISEDDLEKVAVVAKKLSIKIKDVLQADGIRLSQSNGKVAGQDIMHFHVHIIPRYKNDGLSANPTATLQLPQADFEELKNLAEKIKT